jgi:hypothetical protein
MENSTECPQKKKDHGYHMSLPTSVYSKEMKTIAERYIVTFMFISALCSKQPR